jgi:predicted nucleic acid-binding Zn ribbon protein
MARTARTAPRPRAPRRTCCFCRRPLHDEATDYHHACSILAEATGRWTPPGGASPSTLPPVRPTAMVDAELAAAPEMHGAGHGPGRGADSAPAVAMMAAAGMAGSVVMGFDPGLGFGRVRGDDGRFYTFGRDCLDGPPPTRAGTRVTFTPGHHGQPESGGPPAPRPAARHGPGGLTPVSHPSRAPKVPAETARADLAGSGVGCCPVCGAPLRGRQRVCSGRCRARLSRARRTARLRRLLQAALRVLDNGGTP